MLHGIFVIVYKNTIVFLPPQPQKTQSGPTAMPLPWVKQAAFAHIALF